MSLSTIAAPLIQRGIRVAPAYAGESHSSVKGWPDLATTDLAIIAQWNGNYKNLVCVADDNVCIVDLDNAKAAYAMGMPDSLPDTFSVKSPNGFHIYFQQTERSRALGNRTIRNEQGTVFEFKCRSVSVCAPGCTRADGGVYKIRDDMPLAPFPNELVDWIQAHSPKREPRAGVVVAEDFDFDAFLDHYGIEIALVKGPWHSPTVCPVKGARHTKITDCAFYWDGERLGWKDHAASCAGSEMSIGKLIKYLNEEKREPYPGPIWEASDKELEEQEESVPPDEISTRGSVGKHAKQETTLSPDVRASIDDILKEAEEEEDEVDAIDDSSAQESRILSAEEFAAMMSPELRRREFVEASPQGIPPDALYGQLGQWAREMDLPLSIAYPAMLASYSAVARYDEILDVRCNLYAALLMPVGGGKNLALERSVRILGLREGQDYMDCTLGGAGGLFNAVGDKKEGKGKQAITIPGPRKILLNPAELAATLTNTKLENSTLAAHLCNLWDKNRISMPVREGKRDINCRVSILGGLPVNFDAPETFAQYFGEETGRGLHSRFLFGFSNEKLDNRWAERWQAPAPRGENPEDFVIPTTPPTGWTPEADHYFSHVQLPNDDDGRALYNMKRVALLSAAANSDKFVTLDCVKSADLFMLWQIQLKNFFRHGTAQKISSGELAQTVLNTLKRIDAEGKYERSPVIKNRLQINLARVIHKHKWEKYGIEQVQRTIKALLDTGQLEAGYRINTKGKAVQSKQHVVVARFDVA